MRFPSLVMVPVLFGSAVALAQPGTEGPQPDPSSPMPAPAPAPMPAPAPAPAPAMQPPPPEAVMVGADPLKSGGFLTSDRFDMNNRIGAEATYAVLDTDASGTLLGFDVHGSYIDPASHLGGYASLPMAAVLGSDNDMDNTFAIGDLQLGGLYAAPISPTAGVVVRAGAILPTAADDDQAKALATSYGGFRRETDFILAVPGGKGFRLSASPMFRSGNVFGRVDVGLDMAWYSPGNGIDDVRYTALRLNAGIGTDLQTIQLMGELNVVSLSVDLDGTDSESYTDLAVSARVPSGQIEPYFGLVLPLDKEVKDIVTVYITAGLEARL